MFLVSVYIALDKALNWVKHFCSANWSTLRWKGLKWCHFKADYITQRRSEQRVKTDNDVDSDGWQV